MVTAVKLILRLLPQRLGVDLSGSKMHEQVAESEKTDTPFCLFRVEDDHRRKGSWKKIVDEQRVKVYSSFMVRNL